MTKVGLISIVIPALNEEKLLPDCLESLRNQDYTGNYEVIIADNGSTDKTADIARSFGVRVISCAQKKSAFYAREVGAAAARGDIIVQADADTVYPRGWLNRIVDQFAAHPEAVAVAGRFFYRGSTLWSRAEYFLRDNLNRLSAALFGRPMLVSGATLAFRRRAFLEVDGYQGLTYSPDQYGVTTRLSKVGKIRYDKDLYVLTSSRSVQKPTITLVVDLCGHFKRFGLHLAGSWLADFRVSVTRTRARRIAAMLFPSSMLLFLIAVYGYAAPASQVFGKVYYEGNAKDKVVALTFDDGPNEPYTSEILDILDNRGIKATFFAIGKNVEHYPDTAKRIVTGGHILGNHSYTHSANHALTLYGSKDLEHAQLAIFLVVGVTPHLYRPPHGKRSPWEMLRAKKAGLIEVTWTVSTNELHVKSAATLAQQIVNKTEGGEIILLHDGYGTEHNTAKSDKGLTVQALPLIIDKLQAKGYRFVTIPELLGMPAYNN